MHDAVFVAQVLWTRTQAQLVRDLERRRAVTFRARRRSIGRR